MLISSFVNGQWKKVNRKRNLIVPISIGFCNWIDFQKQFFASIKRERERKKKKNVLHTHTSIVFISFYCFALHDDKYLIIHLALSVLSSNSTYYTIYSLHSLRHELIKSRRNQKDSSNRQRLEAEDISRFIHWKWLLWRQTLPILSCSFTGWNASDFSFRL